MVTGSWILDPGYWILVTGHWFPGSLLPLSSVALSISKGAKEDALCSMLYTPYILISWTMKTV
jgi:hypothetical protein